MLSSIDIHRYEMHAYEPALYVVCTNNSFTSIFSCKSSKQSAHIFTNLQAYSTQATNQVLILFCVNFCIYFESSFVSLHSSCLARQRGRITSLLLKCHVLLSFWKTASFVAVIHQNLFGGHSYLLEQKSKYFKNHFLLAFVVKLELGKNK